MEKILKTTGKILGVDFGDVRTGLAVSDPSRLLASGIGYVSPGGIEKTADCIADYVRENKISAVVVGKPINMNGTIGPRAERAEKLIRLLEERVSVPVEPMDERLTTVEATRYLNETNTRGNKRKKIIDTLAAQIILQNALDRLKFLQNQSS